MKSVYFIIIGAIISELVGIIFTILINWFKNKIILVNYFIFKSKETYFKIKELDILSFNYANELINTFNEEVHLTTVKKFEEEAQMRNFGRIF